jgi:hypothetical protein
MAKALDEFGGGSPTNPKVDCYCRPCRAEYGREHYLANRQHYITKAKQRTEERRDRNYELLVDFLLERPCVDCGERDVLVLEFDHLADKEFTIARGFREKSWPEILTEIQKCDVVCSNCHRRRTLKRGGFARLIAAQRHPDTSRTRRERPPQ